MVYGGGLVEYLLIGKLVIDVLVTNDNDQRISRDVRICFRNIGVGS